MIARIPPEPVEGGSNWRWALDRLGLKEVLLGLKGLLVLSLLTLTACFAPPSADGPFQCNSDQTCAEGMVCDDGLCCRPDGAPACRTLVKDDGTCADGTPAQPWFLDSDGDGKGLDSSRRLACAQPFSVPTPGAKWTTEGGDCDDTDPGVVPGVPELCDGLDNDCDGVIDNGLPLKDFFPDADGDGAGDLNASAVRMCAARPGFVDNASDCNDGDAQVHPGAPERCNGEDDNCNGLRDEDVVGLGEACLDTARVGLCQQGRTGCVDGTVTCQQTRFPDDEVCDGLDQNCNGKVDDRPGCGGPANLLSGNELTYGAKDLGAISLGSLPTDSCQRSTTGVAELFSSGVWLISGDTTHVAWVESAGAPWDLRIQKPALHLAVSLGVVSIKSGFPAWSSTKQLMVQLCAADGSLIARYQPDSSRPPNGGSNFDEQIPLTASGNGWNLVTPASPDLSKVKRVELLAQPSAGSNPSFRLTVSKMGFGALP